LIRVRPIFFVAKLQDRFQHTNFYRGSNRLPNRNIVDTRLEKMFTIYGGVLRLTLDIFNLFNTAYPLAVDTHFESEEFVGERIFLHHANSVLGSAIRFKYQIA
jgi:hypothetical protein